MPNRNFGDVTEQILKTVEYTTETSLEQLYRYESTADQLCNHLGLHPKHHLALEIVAYLKELEADSRMTWTQYSDFVLEVQKIQRSAIYTPPEASDILWEKLGNLCMHTFTPFKSTEWVQKISRIIRNVEE